MEASRNITNMPPEVIDNILSFLEPKEQLAFGESCTYINDCVVQHAPRYAQKEIEKTKEAFQKTKETLTLDFPALLEKAQDMDHDVENTLNNAKFLTLTHKLTPEDIMNTQEVMNVYTIASNTLTARVAIANAGLQHMMRQMRF